MSLSVQNFLLKNGRNLSYVDTQPKAADSRPTLVFFHGFPGSCKQGVKLCTDSFPVQLRVISIDRPGLGGSTHDPQRTLLSVAQDLQELLESLRVSSVYLFGISGGGPFATATAFHFEHHSKIRVLKLGLVCPLGSLAVKENRQMMKGVPFLSRLYEWQPWTGVVALSLWRWVFSANPEARMRSVIKTYPPRDQEVLQSQEAVDDLVDYFLSAMKQGVHGLLKDLDNYLNPWPFATQDVKTPTLLWHGTVDSIVPQSVGFWYLKALPDVQSRSFQGEGHFSLPILFMPQILTELIDPAATQPLKDL